MALVDSSWFLLTVRSNPYIRASALPCASAVKTGSNRTWRMNQYRIHFIAKGGMLHVYTREVCGYLYSERRGGIATAPPLRRSYSDRAVTSPGGAFQTDTNLANHRHRTRLLADCQWRCRWRCGLIRPTSKHAEFNQNNTTWPAKANQIDAKKMNVSAASLAPDSSVRKATPSDITERTARSGAVVETIFLSRPRRAQCSGYLAKQPTLPAPTQPTTATKEPYKTNEDKRWDEMK